MKSNLLNDFTVEETQELNMKFNSINEVYNYLLSTVRPYFESEWFDIPTASMGWRELFSGIFIIL